MQAHAVAERVGQLTIARVVLQAHIVANLQFSLLNCDHEEEQEEREEVEGGVVFVWIWWGLVTGM